MELSAFRKSVAEAGPPAGLGLALQALWWDAKGDWKKAHECAQAQDDEFGAWVHAYLHRKEGDLSNAGHWYRQADKKRPDGSLDAEWTAIAKALLGRR
jgi:hypothetical protein